MIFLFVDGCGVTTLGTTVKGVARRKAHALAANNKARSVCVFISSIGGAFCGSCSFLISIFYVVFWVGGCDVCRPTNYYYWEN